MSNADVIIVGGGLGGLTAGATLAKQGRQVLLLEQHYIPGGCATTFKRKDFLMEVGLHEMDGLDADDPKGRIFDYLGIKENVELLQVPELYRVIGAGQDFVYPHGEEASRQALCKQYPEEAEAIHGFYKLLIGVRREIVKLRDKPWILKWLPPLFVVMFPNTVASSRLTLGEYLDKHFTDEGLKLVLIANLVYYHDDPYTMSLTYFAIAQASYIQGGGHFIKGGSQKLSDYLAGIIRSNGGTILLGKSVTSIDVEKGQVKGVAYVDAFNTSLNETTVRTQNVIANAAVPLVADLLPSPHREELQAKIAPLKQACSLLTMYIGFNGDLKKLGNKHYSTFITPEELDDIGKFHDSCKSDFDKRGFVFVDYSQIDAGIAPDGKSFGCICTADYLSDWEHLDEDAYKVKKEEVAQIFLARLDKFLPGSKDTVEHYEIGTSRTIKSYTGSPGGTPYGFAQIPSQAGFKRFKRGSSVKGLRFAGAWSSPGAGFSGAIVSGFLSAIELQKETRSQKAVTPAYLADDRSVRFIERREIATATFELCFEKPPGFDPLPGQYVTLSLDNPIENHIDMPLRDLSIVSGTDEKVVRFAMRESDSSFKKSCLALKPGDTATIYGPTGDFLLPHAPQPIVFLVGGIGVTPIVSMVKALEKRGFPAETHVFYSDKSRQSAAYLDYLKTTKHKNFSLHTVFTKSQNRMDEDFLTRRLDSLPKYRFFVVGTGSFLTSMEAVLRQNGVDPQNIIIDDFG